jgi:hypothetical protein
MSRLAAILLLTLAPASVFAAPEPASFSAARSLIEASTSPGNAYLAGASVVVTAPVEGDLTAVGGSVLATAPVAGDELLFAGSVNSRGPVAGDVRALGGTITILGPVTGDLTGFGFSVRDSGRASGSVFIAAIDVSLTDGSDGPVTLYGNNVSLAGNFSGNVSVLASGRVTLAPNTTIQGKLSYESPEPALIPASAKVAGGVHYTSTSYLPDAGTSRILAILSVGFFLFVRILGALLLAGLLAGLFPHLAETIAEYAFTRPVRSVLLTMLLGFAILVATPVLFILLTLTFVGIGLALLLFVLYALMTILAVMYAGILLGSFFARRFRHRETVLWRDGVVGTLALSLISLVPVIGFILFVLLTVFSAGALLQLFFRTAFPHEEFTPELI